MRNVGPDDSSPSLPDSAPHPPPPVPPPAPDPLDPQETGTHIAQGPRDVLAQERVWGPWAGCVGSLGGCVGTLRDERALEWGSRSVWAPPQTKQVLAHPWHSKGSRNNCRHR